MPSPTLSNISIYPIKSTKGLDLSSSWVDELGLSFDRRFVIADQYGQFITARIHAKLCLIQANLTSQGLILTAPNMPSLAINYQHFGEQYQPVTVWGQQIQSQHCLNNYDLWFSHYLGSHCQLLFFGERSQRQVKNSTKSVAYADGYPLLLISAASLNRLNERTSSAIKMTQFRPNIVVDNTDPFAEDSWKKIRIGDVEFDIVKPCSRCVFTTIDPETGQKNSDREPLKALKTFRQGRGDDKDIYFGQNMIPLNQGQIAIGDVVEIIEQQKPIIYIDQKALTSHQPAPQTLNIQEEKNMTKKINILFDSWNIDHLGNNQDTLLDQGEEAGLIMPYSCRGGMCGRCKVKLQSGDVEQLATDGLMPDEKSEGYILACSCIPKSDIVITKD
jgi:uncharacterized protein YcbX/ferredoxin